MIIKSWAYMQKKNLTKWFKGNESSLLATFSEIKWVCSYIYIYIYLKRIGDGIDAWKDVSIYMHKALESGLQFRE